MKPERIDHVALWIPDRRAVTARVLRFFDLRVLEDENDFTLLGSDMQLGKLTLFDAPGPRDESQLMHVAFRTPHGDEVKDVEVGDALHLLRMPRPEESSATDLDHVALRVPDDQTSAAQWAALGFEQVEPRIEPSARLRLGDTHLELHPGTALPTDRPLLNHIGLLVESIDAYVDGTAGIDLEILETVEAEHSRSVFVQGPNDVRLEFIEPVASVEEQRVVPHSARRA
jgi:catechol 2,3-dioxygenase-like lactoylglutathione lyase family enzyme